MNKILLLLIIGVCPNYLSAQTRTSDSLKVANSIVRNDALSFSKVLKIRKGFESLDDRKDPAIASITLPSGKDNSYLINGGVSVSFTAIRHKEGFKSRKNTFEPFAVLNRNTLLKKEQNNYKIGLSHNLKSGKLNEIEKKVNYLMWSNTLEYYRNKIDTTHSIVATSYLSLIRSDVSKKSLSINQYKDIGEKGFQYYATGNIGVEYQQKFQTNKESQKGTVLRGYYNVGLKFAKKIDTQKTKPRQPTLGSRLVELGINYTGRYDAYNSTDKNEGYLPLLKTEFVLYPTLENSISVGVSYNKGSDPLSGLLDQEFFLLALRLKI